MRILHLAWEYPPLVYGGLGRHVGALSVAQAELGHNVTVVTRGSGEHLRDGVRVIGVPSDPFSFRLSELLGWVGELDYRLGCAARRIDADVVHAHDWMVGRAAAVASQASGARMVATIHATEAGRHSGWLPNVVSSSIHLVEQWLVDEADAIIVCSTAMAAEVAAAHGRADATVIANGIDVSGYQRTTTIDANLLTGSPRLAFVGRIEWEKGVFVAVEAMRTVLEEYPHARLRLVGTGSQMKGVHDLVEELALSEAVELLGHVDEATLRAVYSGADLLLAPSSYEPFGIVALEAAAMGVPMVVGDTGGLAEFVTAERGRRFPPGDADALAQEVLQALAHPDDTRERARQARAALSDYSWHSIAERTVGAYEAAAHRQRPPRQLRVNNRRIW
jgi:glycogen(starch) synthase